MNSPLSAVSAIGTSTMPLLPKLRGDDHVLLVGALGRRGDVLRRVLGESRRGGEQGKAADGGLQHGAVHNVPSRCGVIAEIA